MTEVPGETPVTIPDDEPMVATVVVALLHVPPGAGSDKVVVKPWHTCKAPVIAPGEEFTVIVFVE